MYDSTCEYLPGRRFHPYPPLTKHIYMNNESTTKIAKCYITHIELRSAILALAERAGFKVIYEGVDDPMEWPVIYLSVDQVMLARKYSLVDTGTHIPEVDISELVSILEKRLPPTFTDSNGIKIIVHLDGRVTYGGQELDRAAIDFIVKNSKHSK